MLCLGACAAAHGAQAPPVVSKPRVQVNSSAMAAQGPQLPACRSAASGRLVLPDNPTYGKSNPKLCKGQASHPGRWLAEARGPPAAARDAAA